MGYETPVSPKYLLDALPTDKLPLDLFFETAEPTSPLEAFIADCYAAYILIMAAFFKKLALVTFSLAYSTDLFFLYMIFIILPSKTLLSRSIFFYLKTPSLLGLSITLDWGPGVNGFVVYFEM